MINDYIMQGTLELDLPPLDSFIEKAVVECTNSANELSIENVRSVLLHCINNQIEFLSETQKNTTMEMLSANIDNIDLVILQHIRTCNAKVSQKTHLMQHSMSHTETSGIVSVTQECNVKSESQVQTTSIQYEDLGLSSQESMSQKIDFTYQSKLNRDIIYASSKGDVQKIQALVAQGADVNSLNYYGGPLHNAAKHGHVDTLRYLIECGSNLHAKVYEGKTPLHEAAQSGSLDALDVLIQAGADVHIQDHYGGTPLRSAALWGHIDVVKYLIEKCNSDVNTRDHYGGTPILRVGNIEVLKYLITRGADVNTTDNHGTTPLHSAAEQADLDTLLYLVTEHRVNVNARDKDGITPLHFAIISKNTEVIDLMVQVGAHVNSCDNNGMTPLHYAAEKGYRNVIKSLVKHGANLYARDSNGMRPVDYSKERGDDEVVRYLEQSIIKEDSNNFKRKRSKSNNF